MVKQQLDDLFSFKMKRTLNGYKINFKASEKLKGLCKGTPKKYSLEGKEIMLYDSNHHLFEYDSDNNPILLGNGINPIILRVAESYSEEGLEVISKSVVPIENIERNLQRFGREVSRVYKDFLGELELELILKER